MGQIETRMLTKSIIAIGWALLPDLGKIQTTDDLRKLYEKTYLDAPKGRIANNVGQIFAFVKTAKIGDLVVVPLKTTRNIAIGEISGDYEFGNQYGSDIAHYREVKWIKKDFPRTAFDQDLLYTFGAFMTFCGAKRNDAETRVKAIVEGKKPQAVVETETPEISEAPADIETLAEDQIREFISKKFRGHDFANLVAAILQAQGFTSKKSEPGSDGGVDILASPGILGFGEPRVCVQVKSSDSPADVKIYRELKGTMDTFKATHGILVSFGGFKDSVQQESKKDNFAIRLWDLSDVITGLLENYDKIEPDMKNKLPLKRIWALSPEEE